MRSRATTYASGVSNPLGRYCSEIRDGYAYLSPRYILLLYYSISSPVRKPSSPCTLRHLRSQLTTRRWTLGSLLFLSSWAVMLGPLTYLRHLTSGPRLPFTAAYFGSIGLTLYFTLGVSSFLNPLTVAPLPSSPCHSSISTISKGCGKKGGREGGEENLVRRMDG